MEHMMLCPRCRFWRDGLRVLPCCSAKFCAECLTELTCCPACRSALAVGTEDYKPYKVLVDTIMRKCRHPGCDHQATDILIAHHEASCPRAPVSEVVLAMGDSVETPQVRAARIKSNLDKLRPAKVVTEKNNKQFIEHLVLRTDTLVGLAMKYAVTAQDIQTANHLATGNVHERTRLKIPFTPGKALPEENEKEVMAALRRLALSKFKGATGLKTSEEALYYLDSADYDVEAAVSAFKADSAWEKKKPDASSCIKRCNATSTSSLPSSSAYSSSSTLPSTSTSLPPPIRTPSPPVIMAGPIKASEYTYADSDQPLLSDAYTSPMPRRPRPNLLQEVFCGCFFSKRR